MDLLFSKSRLNVLHLNIKNLLPKINKICMMKKQLGRIFMQSWLDNSIKNTEIEIENNVLVRKDCNQNGGGMSVYIRADIGLN